MWACVVGDGVLGEMMLSAGTFERCQRLARRSKRAVWRWDWPVSGRLALVSAGSVVIGGRAVGSGESGESAQSGEAGEPELAPGPAGGEAQADAPSVVGDPAGYDEQPAAQRRQRLWGE